MTNTGMNPHDQKVRSLAEEFTNKGYVVAIEPHPSELPVDLAGYRPDLIAKRGDEVVVVEVKTSSKRLPVDRLRAIADRIAAHKGWRFVLVTLDEPSNIESPIAPSLLLDWNELQHKVGIAASLVQLKLWEPAVLYLWSLVEVALRRRAEAVHMPLERFPNTRLLKHMYSSGEISAHEFDELQAMLTCRNSVAHGVRTSIDVESVKKAVTTVQSLIANWAN